MGRHKKEQEVPVVGETVEEVTVEASVNVTVAEPSVEVGEATQSPAPEPTPDTPRETIEVDKYLFCKMFSTCVKGFGYTKHAAVTKFGAMLGATTHEEQVKAWQDVQKYLAGVKL